MKSQKTMFRSVIGVLILIGLWWYSASSPTTDAPTSEQGSTEVDDPTATGDGVQTVLSAFAEERSGLVVELSGTVSRILSDDNEGSRHQRFILELVGSHTLLVSHNIDLAPRVPLGVGDVIELRGQYEWNAEGGVIHWTHHDPQGNRPGGWIRTAGETYR